MEDTEKVLIERISRLKEDYMSKAAQLELYGPRIMDVDQLIEFTKGYQHDSGGKINLETNLAEVIKMADERNKSRALLELETLIEMPLKIIANCDVALQLCPWNEEIRKTGEVFQAVYNKNRADYARAIADRNVSEDDVEM